jgi:diguanylate cyclase (GGDEF)-like protein
VNSLSATAAIWAPPRAEDRHAADPALERLRQLLGVEAACITRLTADGPRLVAASGASDLLSDLAPWHARAAAAQSPLVIADTAAEHPPAGAIRFYAGIPLVSGTDGAPLLLNLCDRRPRSAAMAYRLTALAIDVTSRAIISRQAKQIAEQIAYLQYRREQFDRASETARIGIWECELATEQLTWTDGVYDLFELPRGSTVERPQALALYTDASRAAMQAARAKAIATCSDFRVDAEIITAKGNRRWMRLTGAVEAKDGVAVRIFGMKQDITEEKLLGDRTRYLAETDVMTGLANRSVFQNRLNDLGGVQSGQAIGGLLLVDLDGFKQINDTHGHALGDECLKEAAARLTECCSGAELVARIGGDEFAVLVGGNLSVATIEALATTIVATIGRPLNRDGQTLALGASVGIAHNRGGTPEDLFRQADMALYAAKAAGRNTSRAFMA